MLVIERKPTQGFYIGGVYVKVLPGTTKGRIRLGIDAPRSIPILREELADVQSDSHPVIPGPWPMADKTKTEKAAA